MPGKEIFFVFLLLALIIPYQALITPIFFMFASLKLTNCLIGLAIVHTAIQIPFSIYLMRNSFEAVPKELEEAAVIDGCSSWQVLVRIYLPAIRAGDRHGFAVRVRHVVERIPGALVMMNRGVDVHAAAGARERATGNEHRRHRLGAAAGGHHYLHRALRRLLRAAAEILCLRLPIRRGEVRPAMNETRDPPISDATAAADFARKQARQRLTIRDVARISNVSVGTVSKALNHNGSLRQETRDRVIAVAKELGFRPNDLAQSLHRGKTFTVGLISNDSFGRFTMPIMEGLEECLADSRVAVFMANATDDPVREARHVEQLVGKRVDGIVVTARRADQPWQADGAGARHSRALCLLARRRSARLLSAP